MNKPKYIIKSIQPRSGELRDVHQRMLNKKCNIFDLEIGFSAILEVHTDDSETWHRMVYTSIVRDFVEDNNGNLIIETKNTTYELKKI